MVRLAGIEPATQKLEISCSIQLSYNRKTEVPLAPYEHMINYINTSRWLSLPHLDLTFTL